MYVSRQCSLYSLILLEPYQLYNQIFQEIAEFRKLLKYLNDDLAPAVCLFTIVNISWATSGIMWLLNLDKVDTETEPLVGISILNELIWISAVIVPFVQVRNTLTLTNINYIKLLKNFTFILLL